MPANTSVPDTKCRGKLDIQWQGEQKRDESPEQAIDKLHIRVTVRTEHQQKSNPASKNGVFKHPKMQTEHVYMLDHVKNVNASQKLELKVICEDKGNLPPIMKMY